MKILIFVALITLAFAYNNQTQNHTHNETSLHLSFSGFFDYRVPDHEGKWIIPTNGSLFVPYLRMGEPVYVNGTATLPYYDETNSTNVTIVYDMEGFVHHIGDRDVKFWFNEMLIDDEYFVELDKGQIETEGLWGNRTRELEGRFQFEDGARLNFKHIPYRLHHFQNIY
jgi:hypothetical protein